MLLSPGKNGLTSLNKEVRVFKGFMGAWHFFLFLLGEPHANKIPHFGGRWGLEGGGGCKFQFYFYGRGDFSEFWEDEVRPL